MVNCWTDPSSFGWRSVRQAIVVVTPLFVDANAADFGDSLFSLYEFASMHPSKYHQLIPRGACPSGVHVIHDSKSVCQKSGVTLYIGSNRISESTRCGKYPPTSIVLNNARTMSTLVSLWIEVCPFGNQTLHLSMRNQGLWSGIYP